MVQSSWCGNITETFEPAAALDSITRYEEFSDAVAGTMCHCCRQLNESMRLTPSQSLDFNGPKYSADWCWLSAVDLSLVLALCAVELLR